MSGLRWQPLLPLAELAAGRMRATAVGGTDVLVCRTRAGLYALDNRCTHPCARPDEGRLRGERLLCPLHGAAFELATGAALSGPATLGLRTHRARVVDGIVEIEVAP